MTTAAQFKVTYTSASLDMGEFHKHFDAALAKMKAAIGRDHPLTIDGKSVVSSAPPLEDYMPSDSAVLLGRFSSAQPEHVYAAVSAARRAQKAWGALPWQKRLEYMRRASAAIRDRKLKSAP